jgi:hypothetical protein
MQPRATHRQVLPLTLVLGLGGLLAAAAAVNAAIASVHHVSASTGRVTIAGLDFTYPSLNGAEWLLLALATLGIVVICTAVRAAWHQHTSCRAFIARLAIIGPLDGDDAVNVIADRRPQAFCAGYMRPRIYVSQRTLDLLADAELEAVLAHEHHHRRVRDPLRVASGRVLSQALFFLPALRSLCDRCEAGAELCADDAAIRASGGRKEPLAAALLAFDENGPPEATGISPERVDSLLGEATALRLPWARITASVGALAGMGVLIWLTSTLAAAAASFNLPILASQPCIVMTMLLPCLGCAAMIARREGGRRAAGRPRQLLAQD